MINLLGQRPATTADYSSRGGREQDRVIGRHLVHSQKEHAARLAEHLAGNSPL